MGNKPNTIQYSFEATRILLESYGKPTSSVSVFILVKRLANAFRKLAIKYCVKLPTVSCE